MAVFGWSGEDSDGVSHVDFRERDVGGGLLRRLNVVGGCISLFTAVRYGAWLGHTAYGGVY